MRKTAVAILSAGMLASVIANELTTSPADDLRTIRQDQYRALIYVVNECRFEPSTRVASALLRFGLMAEYTATIADPRARLPILGTAQCASLARTLPSITK